jgi:F0F1-type ATP synthase epsilon subunit
MKLDTQDKLKVVVRRPTTLEWEGEAWGVSSNNKLGPFDVLPEHTQYVGMISDYVVVHRAEGDKRYTISTALMKVEDNVVEIWLSE